MRLTAVILLLSACSWIGSPERPVTNYTQKTQSCSMAAPLADTIAASLLITGGLAIAVADNLVIPDVQYRGAATLKIALPAVVIGAVFIPSAVHGWRAKRRCEHALSQTKTGAALATPAR
ncbi:MAG TPA: hypothetical protein VFV99_10480 [Kofleriaceae bacterium]|nr:hypothetical protein [Kofleriaceae bacterium]